MEIITTVAAVTCSAVVFLAWFVLPGGKAIVADETPQPMVGEATAEAA
jgi:hypothetical protein